MVGVCDETLLAVFMIVRKSVFWPTIVGIGQQACQHLGKAVFSLGIFQPSRALGIPLCSVNSAPVKLADH